MIKKFILLLLLCLIPTYCLAETTAGGVNWLDPLNYTKPAFYPITVPDEATCPNKYYVDQASGSGTACSEASPCAWAGLSGKAGITGGPAYVYLKGNARLVLTGTLYGSAGNEVVVKPWPGSSTPVVMTTTTGSSYTDANIIKSSNVHHVIIDGGPDMLFRFSGANSSSGEQNAYTLVISSNYVTVARCRVQQNNRYGPGVGIATGTGTYNNISLINNEIYDVLVSSGAAYGIYIGGGTDCNANDTTANYIYVLNNIIRNIYASGVQNEPRNSASYCYFNGNAIHDVGQHQDRPALDISATACGGSFSNVWTTNNLLFNLGGGGVEIYASSSTLRVYNNTIYNFASYTPISLNSHGITSASDGAAATVRNNIIMKTNNGASYVNRNSGWTASNNLCPSGCNYSQAEGSLFASTTDGSTYLTLTSGATAIGNGYDLSGTFTESYFGDTRSVPFDIGADEYGTSDSTAPTVDAFVIPATSSSLTVDITTFSASDAVGVTGYCINESSMAPTSGSCSGSGWAGSAQTQYVFSTEGAKTLYAWAKDAAGNISSSLNDSVTITLPQATASTMAGGSVAGGSF